MSKVLRIGASNYKVVVNNGGTVTLDVGDSPGKVVVTGDLVVQGETTSVNTSQITIEDQILILNKGFDENGNALDLPAGIEDNGDGRVAGIEINRGSNPSYPPARFVFDETISWYDSQTGASKSGAFSMSADNDNNFMIGLRTNSIITKSNADLVFTLGTGTLSIRGSAGNYEDRVTDPDDIPNVQWVDDFVVSYFETNPPQFIKRSDSVLQIYDQSVDDETLLQLKLDDQVAAEWRPNSFEVQNIKIAGNEISTTTSNQDLIISCDGTGSVVVNDVLKLTISDDPVSDVDGIKIYAKTEAYGGSGVFFVNKENTQDELISKRKAIAYSMIF
jgi:hypothetical protein